VIPFSAQDELQPIIARIAGSGYPSFLNVLKRFGPANPAPLSFPMPGWTLTVDFPIAAGLGRLCDELDDIVGAVGGRLYAAKDSRTTPATFQAMYPRLAEWQRTRDAIDPDRVFVSDMARRLCLQP
jgi:decaprenylphospho-beta-D-ribofuranose 2-oxidase